MLDAANGQRHPRLFLLWVNAGVWALYYLLYVIASLFEGALPNDLWQRALSYAISAGMTYWACAWSLDQLQRGHAGRWFMVISCAIIVTIAHNLCGSIIYKLSPPSAWIEQAPFHKLVLSGFVYDTPVMTTAFFAMFAVYFGWKSAERERALLKSDIAARHAQLETLRFQLNPHFLFNTLNTLSSIVMDGQNEQAERAIILLSRFLRRSIDADPLKLIPLEEELENVNDYLSIERIRFEERLDVNWERDPEADSILVPPFMLQPILENTIKHAVSKVSRPVRVDIKTSVNAGDLEISVNDNGPGLSAKVPQKAPGLGLEATRERLALTYADRAELCVSDQQAQGFLVKIRIEQDKNI